MIINANSYKNFSSALKVQKRVIWALLMREMITRYGREGLGVLWFFVEPLMFIVGVSVLWSMGGQREMSTGNIAEFALVSYSTILLWRNATNRMSKSIEVNKPLLHHRPIRAMDFYYSRLILELASVTASTFVLYLIFYFLGIAHLPQEPLSMILGWLMIAWFTFGFAITIGALSEISETIDKISHVLLYFMLPVCGAFIPTYLIPEPAKTYVLYFPLVNCVEYFRYGYYGAYMKSYFDIKYTIIANLCLTLVALLLLKSAIRKNESS